MRDPNNRTRMLVRWTRESGESPGHGKNLLSRQEQEKDRIWKVAVFLKDCFHARQILRAMKIGHWKGCHGSERRLKQCVCARENPPHMNRSVRRPTNPETKNWQHSDSFLSAYLSIPLRSQRRGVFASGRRGQTQTRQDTKAMVITIIVFFVPANEAKVGLFTDSAEKSNLRGSPRAEKLAFGTSQNEML